jgi:hypothetical protein
MRLRFIGILAALAMILAFATPVAAQGNAGTIKVDGVDFDTTPGNEPHVDCVFDVDFYGFPVDAAAEVLFEAIAPTTPTGTVFTQAGLDIGDDAAGGGTDLDGSFTFDLSDELSGFAPHPEQGYHVKLTVTTTVPDQPSDVKTKVYWIEPCAPTPTPTLSLEKVVTGTGASGTQPFPFTVDGGASFNLTADALPMQVATTAGSHTIIEGTLPAGYSLTGITCTSAIAPVVNLTTRTVTVTVGANEDVTCTFTNNLATVTVLSPSLTLDKAVTSGNAALAFGFTLNGTAIAGLSANDAPRVISTASGSHTIVELSQSGWTLANVVCRDNATSVALTTTAVASGVTVTVGADQDVTCTFTNSPGGTLGGNPTPTPTPVVRQGTLAGSLPNTAMDGPMNQLPVIFLALLTLGSLGYLGRANLAAVNRRR